MGRPARCEGTMMFKSQTCHALKIKVSESGTVPTNDDCDKGTAFVIF
jgi:hypothetical protein